MTSSLRDQWHELRRRLEGDLSKEDLLVVEWSFMTGATVALTLLWQATQDGPGLLRTLHDFHRECELFRVQINDIVANQPKGGAS